MSNMLLQRPLDQKLENSALEEIILQHPGGYSLEFLVGVCRPHLQIQTQFQTKKCHFPHTFSDLASKIHTRFQT